VLDKVAVTKPPEPFRAIYTVTFAQTLSFRLTSPYSRYREATLVVE
jgi:hypothetical protein